MCLIREECDGGREHDMLIQPQPMYAHMYYIIHMGIRENVVHLSVYYGN